MSHSLEYQRQLRPLETEIGLFPGLLPSLSHSQPHSSRHPPHKPASDHLDIGWRKQDCELRRGFNTTPVTHFGMPKLAFDDPHGCSTLPRTLALSFSICSINTDKDV